MAFEPPFSRTRVNQPRREVDWLHLNQKMSGSSVFTPTAPQPTAMYEFKDQNTVVGQVRVQRNF